MNWRRNRRTSGNQAFIDLLYNKSLWFVVLFILAFVLINPIVRKTDIDTKAELLVTIDWPVGNNDVDLWCQDPNNNIVWYSDEDEGFMHLDRDDLGTSNDTVTVGGKRIYVPLNREIVSLRGIIPGEYVCNVHLYKVGDGRINPDSVGQALLNPIEVTMLVQKINPTVTIIFKNKVTLRRLKQEITMVRFTLDVAGDVSAVDTMPPKKLVGSGAP